MLSETGEIVFLGVLVIVGIREDVHPGWASRKRFGIYDTLHSGPNDSNLCYFLYRGFLGGFKPRFRARRCAVNYHFIVLISFLRKCLRFSLKSYNSVNF